MSGEGQGVGMRLTSVSYPNGRKGFFDYGDGDANDAFSRLAAIQDDDGSGGADDVLSGYGFNGLSRLMREE